MYEDAHRMFLQVLTAKRILLGSEVKQLFDKCRKISPEVPNDLQQFVMDINEQLEVMHLSIRKSVQEDHNGDSQCFVLVNTLNVNNSDASRMISSFTPQEVSLFRRVIEEIVQSDDGCIGENVAINLASQITPRMKISDSEMLIERLVSDNWLLIHDGELTLSALTNAEIQPYLEEQYGNIIQKCHFCKILTFRGHRCNACSTRVHRQCGFKYWHKLKKSPSCPEDSCKEAWQHIDIEFANKRFRS